MTPELPSDALSGVKVGHICDRCNRGVRNGAPVRFYATRYEDDGWVLRRLYCDDCGELHIAAGTLEANEVVGEAIWLNHLVTVVRISDRTLPGEGNVP